MGDTRDPERTKRALLDAALAEFAAKGRAGARTSAIAERAGVNKQLISHHFGGKDGLYRALVERWAAEEATYDDPEAPLADVVGRYVEDATRHRDLHRLLMRASLEDEDEGGGIDQGDVERMRRRQEAGEIAPELDPGFVLLALQAVAALGVTFPGDVRRVTGLEPDSEELAAWQARQARALVRALGG